MKIHTRCLSTLSIVICTLAAGCASGGSERAEVAALDASAARGKAVAEERCAGCHAIGPSGMSDNPRAPLWRELVATNDADALKRSFSEGKLVRHEGARPHAGIHLYARRDRRSGGVYEDAARRLKRVFERCRDACGAALEEGAGFLVGVDVEGGPLRIASITRSATGADAERAAFQRGPVHRLNRDRLAFAPTKFRLAGCGSCGRCSWSHAHGAEEPTSRCRWPRRSLRNDSASATTAALVTL